jgi:prevent-host-death family protein
MTIFTVHKAKTELSKLLARAEAGEEIIIARGNKPVARLAPIHPPAAGNRGLGAWKGKVTVPDSFFDPLPGDELERWEGGSGPAA